MLLNSHSCTIVFVTSYDCWPTTGSLRRPSQVPQPLGRLGDQRKSEAPGKSPEMLIIATGALALGCFQLMTQPGSTHWAHLGTYHQVPGHFHNLEVLKGFTCHPTPLLGYFQVRAG